MQKLTTIVAINGKKLKPAQLNLLKKLDSLGVVIKDELFLPNNRTNPFSGKTCCLPPLAATLYDWIILSYHNGKVGVEFPVSIWDRTRYLFLEFWPDEYYDLID